jgi:glycosyltransferase involved in cell wall biosynthesis
MKPSLTFYTNIPSPYNSNLFEALSEKFILNVIYYSKLEKGRQWDLDTDHPNYKHLLLEDNIIAKLIQKYITEFHFSSKIFHQAFNDNSSSILLSGNYFSANTYIVLLVAKIRNKKIYWFGEKLLPTSNILKKVIKFILLKPILNSCKAIFCVGNEAIISYKYYGYKGLCLNTPYSINTSNFNKSNLLHKKLESLREKLNPHNDLIILTSGSLIRRKGIDIAIKTFLKFSEIHNKKASLWILGDGSQKNELVNLTKDSIKIFFHGFVQPEELPYYFNLAHIFLFCSRYDGWAVVINEALASGLPVVVSNKVSASELIINDINGYVCDSENIDMYLDSLIKISISDNLRSYMSEENYKLSQKITSKNIANIFYNEIIKYV